MPVFLVIAWFMFGFVVAAVLLYGPVTAKALRAMKRESEYGKKYVVLQDKHIAHLKKYGELATAHGDLQQKYIDSLTQSNDLTKQNTEILEEHAELLKDYTDLLEDFEDLEKDHKALLWRAGGGVEGTA